MGRPKKVVEGAEMVQDPIPVDSTSPSSIKSHANVEVKSPASILIAPPNFKVATFSIIGTAPLVIHRFSIKTQALLRARAEGLTSKGKKDREPIKPEQIYNDARYIAKAGWDGFHAASIRNACIDAGRLCNFKMVLAKMSIFVIADGWDKFEPQIPLIRIIGNPVMQEDMARVETGQPYNVFRPAYHNWKANITMRWDGDQFNVSAITNLMTRVGAQVGIGEGRPFSKNSAGMGWGTFELDPKKPVTILQ